MKVENEHLRVVLDTNVLLSALGFQKHTLRIWELARERRFSLYLSRFIISELAKNLVAKADLSADEARLLLIKSAPFWHVVIPTRSFSVIKAKNSDNFILACAAEARADVLVTGDRKHIRPLNFFHGIEILTPREFLDKYFPEPEETRKEA